MRERHFDDVLWKCILEDTIYEFLECCHPALHKRTDTSKPVEFIDKEFPRIYKQSSGKKRRADLLAKVFLLTGEPVVIIIHVEAQGYKDDTFAYWMEVYNYRSHDRYQLPVESIALLTDSDPDFRPAEYRHKVIETERILRFRMFKLLDHPPEVLQQWKNSFAIVLEAAWYALKQNKLNDEKLLEVKIDLMKRLLQYKIPRKKIIAVLTFIQLIVRFDSPEKKANFDAELENFEQESTLMEANVDLQMPKTFGYYLKLKNDELKKAWAAKQKAEAEKQKAEAEKQKAEAEKRQAILAMLTRNFPVAEICEIMQVEEAEVLDLKRRLDSGTI